MWGLIVGLFHMFCFILGILGRKATCIDLNFANSHLSCLPIRNPTSGTCFELSPVESDSHAVVASVCLLGIFISILRKSNSLFLLACLLTGLWDVHPGSRAHVRDNGVSTWSPPLFWVQWNRAVVRLEMGARWKGLRHTMESLSHLKWFWGLGVCSLCSWIFLNTFLKEKI